MADQKVSKIVGEFQDKTDYDRKYFAEKYSQVKLSMPKEEADTLNEYCKKHNLTRAGFIRDLIKREIEKDDSY